MSVPEPGFTDTETSPVRPRAVPIDSGRKADAPELIDMLGGRLEVVARMGPRDDDVVLLRTCMQAGKMVPLHSHIDPECFYVLSGRIEIFVIADRARWREVPAGRSLLVADGVRHAVRNTGAAPADLILVTNNRLSRYFREAGRPVVPGQDFGPPSPDDIQRLFRVSESYGYWLASPDESAAAIANAESLSDDGESSRDQTASADDRSQS